jgi:hypothetical protein
MCISSAVAGGSLGMVTSVGFIITGIRMQVDIDVHSSSKVSTSGCCGLRTAVGATILVLSFLICKVQNFHHEGVVRGVWGRDYSFFTLAKIQPIRGQQGLKPKICSFGTFKIQQPQPPEPQLNSFLIRRGLDSV